MIELCEFFRRNNELKIINLLKKKRISYSNEELLFEAIRFNMNNLAEYIIKYENVNLNYTDKHKISILENATMNGNIFSLDLLKKNNICLFKEYSIKSSDIPFNNLYYIRDLDTLKYFESNIDKKFLKKNMEPIIFNTLPSSDIEFLDYIIKNYKIKLNELQDNIKANTKSFKNQMKEREDKLRDQVLFVLEILPDKKKYKVIKDNALKKLDLISEQNKKIEEYYNYVEKCYEEEK